jgi:two-component system chemotaxis response regulator CheB
MDGITAVRHIMAEQPSRILMLSALTQEGARETLDALEAGAIDFLPKERDKAGVGTTSHDFATHFLERVRAIGRSSYTPCQLAADIIRSSQARHPDKQTRSFASSKIKLVVIGASTGGPLAVQSILSSLPQDFSLPLLVAVHMPGSFTTAYAERLNMVSAIEVREAIDGEPLSPGCALIAPGGKQMTVERAFTEPIIRITDRLPGDIYHPCVDRLFHSVAKVFNHRVLGMILTGMGSDGLQGALHIKQSGGHVWTQDEPSCVVYGMPQVVEKAGLADRVLPIFDIGQQLINET